MGALSPLKPCPDEEGIKTPCRQTSFFLSASLKPCPDEEGIKTHSVMAYCDASHDFETLP